MNSRATALFLSILQFICSLCCKLYKNRRNLQFHLRGVHKVGPPITCYCGRDNFTSEASLTCHRRKCPVAMEIKERTTGSTEIQYCSITGLRLDKHWWWIDKKLETGIREIESELVQGRTSKRRRKNCFYELAWFRHYGIWHMAFIRCMMSLYVSPCPLNTTW